MAVLGKLWSWKAILWAVPVLWAFGGIMISTGDFAVALWLFVSGNVLLTAKIITSPELESLDSYRAGTIGVVLILMIAISIVEIGWLEGRSARFWKVSNRHS
jgi:hypothetical protein